MSVALQRDNFQVYPLLFTKGVTYGLNIRLDLVRVEWVKIWQLLERVLTVSVGIEFSAHEMVLDGRRNWN
jgi:hypothetical protein